MYAIIAAAGSGSRMRGAAQHNSKILFALHQEQSALSLSIANFAATTCCKGIVVAAREEDAEQIEQLLKENSPALDCLVVEGGADRQASIYQALKALESRAEELRAEFVAVHDAARPFCSPAKIEEVFQAAKIHSAAILATPAVSTLKLLSDESVISKTLDRSQVWEAQTPQVFRYELLREAHEKGIEDGVRGTDDSELVERIGREVRVVLGERENIKLTTPSDLRYARFLLNEGRQTEKKEESS